MATDKIGVIIPAYNEEEGLPHVLDIVCSVPWLMQIVIVDDGSQDNTFEVIQHFCALDPRLVAIKQEKNQGKGSALLNGLRALDDIVNIIVFLDADIIGFGSEHLEKLIEPVCTKQCEMTVAVFRHGHWTSDFSHMMTPNLSGQRCLQREDARKALSPLVDSGYGVEIGLTVYAKHQNWRKQYVDWEGTKHILKEEKLGLIQGIKFRSMMYQEILATWMQSVNHHSKFFRN